MLGTVKERLLKDVYLSALLLLFILNTIFDIIWLKLETVPPGWDEALHLTKSLEYYNILTNPSVGMISNLIQVDNYYPPFYHFSTVLTYFLFGTSIDAAISINIFYFGILLLSVYGIGKYIYNRETGLVAAVFISLYPSIVGMRRFYLIEVALIATVAFSVYMLLLCDHFKNRKYSIGFGIALAVSLLTKWTSIFFIIGPLAFILYESFSGKNTAKKTCAACGKEVLKEVAYGKEVFCSNECKKLWKKNKVKNKAHAGRQVTNFTLMAITALVLSLIWYVPHMSEVYNRMVYENSVAGAREGDPSILSLESITYYTFALSNFQTSFSFFVIFLIGFIFLLGSKQKSKYFLLSWILIPYIVMTLFGNKNDRYTFGSIAAVAIISAFWITTLANKKTKIAVISIIMLAGLFQLFTISQEYGIAKDLVIKTPVGNLDLYSDGVYGTRPPVKQDWKVEEVLNSIMSDAMTNPRMHGRIGYLGVLPDMPYTNGLTFGYYSYMKNLPFNVISVPYFEALEPFEQNFLNFDYLILKTGENSGASRKKLVSEMHEYFNQHSSSYFLLAKFTLPDGSELSVYRNTFMPK